jgi:nucleoside-diphosphate-sugar epimerase
VGHRILGTTRSPTRATELRALGAEPVVLDVFDAAALRHAAVALQAEVVVHQLTDLTGIRDPARAAEALARNARIREGGTRNLVDAALAAGARRLVAQSIAWVYGRGGEPHGEDDLLDLAAEGSRALTMRGVVALESRVLNSPPLAGLVLRYGQLYGPGTGADAPAGAAPVHVDAAAYAALLAIDRGAPGIFNIAEPNKLVATEKARAELGWRAEFRLPG